MKRIFFISLLPLAASLAFTSCADEIAEEFSAPVTDDPAVRTTETIEWPTPDNATRHDATPALALKQLLTRFDRERALSLGETDVTDEEFSEIKQFVDENLKGDTDYDTYTNIFSWIYKNMTYASSGTAYLRPYDVFKNRRCICQGYANLLKTMCLTQNIPAFNANGWLSTLGGHAWNYVYVDSRWYVSDPTNYAQYTIGQTSQYQSKLIPQRVDVVLFDDDDFEYSLRDGQLTIVSVKNQGTGDLIIPYSSHGYQVQSFMPDEEVPSGYTRLIAGRNLSALGGTPSMLTAVFPTLESVEIDPFNRYLNSYHGTVYEKNGSLPYYIAPAARSVMLKGVETAEKNIIYNLPYVEEITFGEGTVNIEAYAIESCPALRTVYIPTTVTNIDPEALYRCPDDVQILTMPTGITEVKR